MKKKQTLMDLFDKQQSLETEEFELFRALELAKQKYYDNIESQERIHRSIKRKMLELINDKCVVTFDSRLCEIIYTSDNHISVRESYTQVCYDLFLYEGTTYEDISSGNFVIDAADEYDNIYIKRAEVGERILEEV